MSKKTKNARWTSGEVSALKRAVRESSSKTEAFKQFSKNSGRPFPAVCAKYYSLESKKVAAKKPKEKVNIKAAASSFKFQIDDSWTPTKVRTTQIDDFMISIAKTADDLNPLQSFAIPYKEMNQRYGWKEASCSNGIRHFLKKIMSSNSYGRIRIHEVKDHNKKLIQVRIRRVNEAV